MVRDSSVISQIFQGQLRSELRCHACDTLSVSYSTFSTLSAPVPGEAGSSPTPVHLNDCLHEFSRPHVLDGDNGWQCPECTVTRDATKTMAITKFPSVFIVHLMRFSFDGHAWNKIDQLVEFPVRPPSITTCLPRGTITAD
ncbi:hypothetical protein BC828DRAFT_380908 [Blastocladiella britannica]|nr:hypothetical protein BC828DRAFT_380908 [Blastocladiella britannica]